MGLQKKRNLTKSKLPSHALNVPQTHRSAKSLHRTLHNNVKSTLHRNKFHRKRVSNKSRSTLTPTKNISLPPDQQLDIPTINSIVPANAVDQTAKFRTKLPKLSPTSSSSRKILAGSTQHLRRKSFVDDPTSLLAIFSHVNASVEGKLDCQLAHARQLEEIREARRLSAQARRTAKLSHKTDKLEQVKYDLRRQRSRKKRGNSCSSPRPSYSLSYDSDSIQHTASSTHPRKRVSFALNSSKVATKL